MISECTHDIQNGIIDIFVLYDKDVLIGEIHAMYESDDENHTVLAVLKENGYCEFAIGVEDDKFGFLA